ncbi:MAG: HAMP domain-containing protein, partial [Solirubrobacteraceae bacterium]|nr:HAMP domain-containing protein [Solirubrobacteraceae bacterium]
MLSLRRCSDWPIAGRLAAGFGVICAVLAAVVVIGWVSLEKARDGSKEVAQLAQLNDGFRTFQTQVASMQNLATQVAAYAQSGDESGAGRQAHEMFTQVLADTSDAEIAAMRRQLTPSEQQLMDAIGEPIEKFMANEAEMFEAYQAGDLDKGNQIALSNPQYAQETNEITGRLAASINARQKAKTQEVQDETAAARRLMLILGIAALVVAAAVGFVIARSIRRPARQMVAAAHGLAEGDVEQEIELRSRDELGQMADAFRGVIAYQRGLAGAAQRVADGDLTVEVEPKSERDTLGRAFATMLASVREVVGRMSQTAAHLAEASQQMASTSEEAGRAVGEIAHAVGEVASGAERQVRTVDETRVTAEQTAIAAQEARELADQGARTS